MAEVVKAPNNYYDIDFVISIFLGGSIDMGAAENWQEKLTEDLNDLDDILILNPRRDDWDSTWVQAPTPGTQFHEQVDWELQAQEFADILVYYFAPDSKSPITLFELGLFGDSDNTVVYCPKEFYRYGNVKMVCDRYDIKIVETYDELLSLIKYLYGYNQTIAS